MNIKLGNKRLYSMDWTVFFQALWPWKTLPPSARRKMVDRLMPSDYTPVNEFGEDYEAIALSGLVEISANEKGIRIKNEFWPFLLMIRELKGFHRHTSTENLAKFLEHYFSLYQIESMGTRGFGYGRQELALIKFTSEEWVMDFLKKKEGKQWESGIRVYDDPYFMTGEGTFPTLQKIVSLLLDKKQPVAIRDLPELINKAPGELGNALNAGLRYLLFYFSTDTETLEPILFIWPEIIRRINRQTLAMPAPVPKEGEENSEPFLALDMAVILTECMQEPFRIRANDFLIYEKSKKLLDKQIPPVDDWVFHNRPDRNESRVDHTIWFARSLMFLERKESKGSPLRYEVSPKGKKWLAMSLKERLKALIETTRPDHGVYRLLESVRFYNTYQSKANQDYAVVEQALIQAFEMLLKDNFYPLEESLEYWACERNPLLRKDKEGQKWLRRILHWDVQQSQSILESIWKKTVEMYLFEILQPRGGLRLCRRTDGSLLFAINGIGRYILGFDPDFEIEEEALDLVVQPNFEVVFLAPSVQAEAVFSHFAERVGRGVGTLFRITKKSIRRAAGMGMKLETIMQDLARLSRAELPQNVRHEVQEWHQSCRHISVHPVFLVECPDENTAAVVCAKAGKEAKTITDTTVALPKDFDKNKLYSKLKEIGVFIRQEKGE